MRTKFKVTLTLMLALVVQITFAQNKVITGVVTEEGTGTALPGVNVIIKGTNTGVSTDFDGKYTIKAKSGDVLVFSYIGYTTVTKTVGASNTINVTIRESNERLEDVIIVGYAKTKTKAFTGTAVAIKPKDLKQKNVSNISKALAGEVAGVTVINGSGQPGTSATVRIRGFGSVNGNRSPLYVVNGVPFSGSINTINPADIKSTVILKDATATAIYGSRGANGVILIQTKEGKRNSSSLEVNVRSGTNLSLIPRYNMVTDPDLYIETAWKALKNSGEAAGVADPVAYANKNLFGKKSSIDEQYNMWLGVKDGSDLIDPTTGRVKPGVKRKYTPERWRDYGFQIAARNEVNLSMTGGTDKSRYYTSVGYLDDHGYIINSSFRRISSRLNLSFDPVKKVEIKTNIGYAYGKTIANGQAANSKSIFWFVDNIPSIYPLFLRDKDGNKIKDDKYGGYRYDYGRLRGFGAFTNSIASAHYDLNAGKRHSLNGDLSLNYKFTDNLVLENKYGMQYFSNIYNSIRNPFYGSAAGQKGALYKSNSNALTQNLLNLLRYSVSFGDERHNFSALVAHEANYYKSSFSSVSKEKVVNVRHGLDSPTNYILTSSPSGGFLSERALESYFGQLNYNFDQKYFFSASIRRDGSSRFARNKWGTFGSAGLSWVISNENFLKESSIDLLKAKVSYGILGDEAGVGFYSGVDGYDIDVIGKDISLIRRSVSNPDLTWETSKMFQTGIEFAAFRNAFSLNLDYYRKNTTNLIFNRRIPISSGDALITVNDGELLNTGIEFDLKTSFFRDSDFKVGLSLNGEFLRNELLRAPIDPATGKEKLLDIAGVYGRAKGHSLYDFYIPEWAGVDKTNGDPLWVMYYDDLNKNEKYDKGEEIASLTDYKAKHEDAIIKTETTNKYTKATSKFIGKTAIPVVRGGFRANFSYKRFSLSTQFLYSLGGYAYDSAYANLMDNAQIGNQNYHMDLLNAWEPDNKDSDIPRLYSNHNTRVNSTSSRFITKSDYLVLNNLRLGYTFGGVKTKAFKSLGVWITGDNLMLLSHRQGFNPSTSVTGGSSIYRYSPLTTLSLGLNIKF